MKNVLVTGCAGFIGFHISTKLLNLGFNVVGIDNLNDYYDVNLKIKRLEQLKSNSNFEFIKQNIQDDDIINIELKNKIDIFVHMAAQAGVRFSFIDPDTYFESNIKGTYNILKLAKKLECHKLIFASTSSVYGDSPNLPNTESDSADNPIQFYAASKRVNELMVQNFALMEKIPCFIFRFFTVYGPWGRPDMALFKFTRNILENKEIEVYNNGDHKRSFTYIDDVVHYITCAVMMSFQNSQALLYPNNYKIWNLGNSESRSLTDYIKIIEHKTGKKARMLRLGKQKGDILETYADNSLLLHDFGDHDFIPIEMGISKFIEWYVNHYRLER